MGRGRRLGPLKKDKDKGKVLRGDDGRSYRISQILACLRMVPHHYQTEATARGSMVTWVRAGKVPGVEERRVGRLIQWWPKEDAS